MCKIRSFRERKRTARLDLHNEMQVEAFYYAKETSQPVLVHVRVWDKWLPLGAPSNSSDGYSERLEVVPKVLFLRSEVSFPAIGSLVVVSENEIYRVMSNEAPDFVVVTSLVAQLLPSDKLIGKLAAPI